MTIGETIIRGEMTFQIVNIIKRGLNTGFQSFVAGISEDLIVCRKIVSNKVTVVTLKESVLLGLERYSEFDAVRDK